MKVCTNTQTYQSVFTTDSLCIVDYYIRNYVFWQWTRKACVCLARVRACVRACVRVIR